MSSIARPWPVCVGIRLASAVGRILQLVLRVFLVGLAMGVTPPSRVVKVLRVDDPVVQVEDEEKGR